MNGSDTVSGGSHIDGDTCNVDKGDTATNCETVNTIARPFARAESRSWARYLAVTAS